MFTFFIVTEKLNKMDVRAFTKIHWRIWIISKHLEAFQIFPTIVISLKSSRCLANWLTVRFWIQILFCGSKPKPKSRRQEDCMSTNRDYFVQLKKHSQLMASDLQANQRDRMFTRSTIILRKAITIFAILRG